MAVRETHKLSRSERYTRSFSDSFKLQKVREIETGKSRVSDICKQYEVSNTSVYRWLDQFGLMKDKKERLIIETQSDTRELLELKKKVAELERIVGQKQILIDFKDKMIDIAEEMYGIDIKKKLSTRQPDTSGDTAKDIPSV
jgi:transposase-like protein